ncbi:MAG: hypothetical protein IJL06_06720, partial [Kiritimatiellae bacterium]|nr:hypothetical protein [Kiritimatiellia bacterium]
MKPDLATLLKDNVLSPPLRDGSACRAALGARGEAEASSDAALGVFLRSALPSPALRPAAGFRADAA